MQEISDSYYSDITSTLEELKKGEYKTRVNRENRNHDYNKFAVDREECNIVIRQNIEKGFLLTQDDSTMQLPDLNKILLQQADSLNSEQKVWGLCTCAYYIADYNPKMIERRWSMSSLSGH